MSELSLHYVIIFLYYTFNHLLWCAVTFPSFCLMIAYPSFCFMIAYKISLEFESNEFSGHSRSLFHCLSWIAWTFSTSDERSRSKVLLKNTVQYCSWKSRDEGPVSVWNEVYWRTCHRSSCKWLETMFQDQPARASGSNRYFLDLFLISRITVFEWIQMPRAVMNLCWRSSLDLREVFLLISIKSLFILEGELASYQATASSNSRGRRQFMLAAWSNDQQRSSWAGTVMLFFEQIFLVKRHLFCFFVLVNATYMFVWI